MDDQDNTSYEDIRNETHKLTGDDPEFFQKELDTGFRSANRGKAPGLNGLPVEIVELLYRANKPLHVEQMDKCLKEL